MERAVLALNALLGLGTMLAPVFVAVFIGLGFWWVCRSSSPRWRFLCFCYSAGQPPNEDGGSTSGRELRQISHKLPFVSVFAAFAFVYEVCETVNANWAPALHDPTSGATPLASWRQQFFGGRSRPGACFLRPSKMVSRETHLRAAAGDCGRVCRHGDRAGNQPLAGLTFALAGLGCAALLPLTIGFGRDERADQRRRRRAD